MRMTVTLQDGKPWGRRKQEITITCVGDLTEKQYEEVERRMQKILEKFNMGYVASLYELDEYGFYNDGQEIG